MKHVMGFVVSCLGTWRLLGRGLMFQEYSLVTLKVLYITPWPNNLMEYGCFWRPRFSLMRVFQGYIFSYLVAFYWIYAKWYFSKLVCTIVCHGLCRKWIKCN